MAVTDERIRERAREILKGVSPSVNPESSVYEWEKSLLDRVTAFALSERDAAMEQCAQMCDQAAEDSKMKWYGGVLVEGFQKLAAAIRTRMAAQGKLRKPLPVGWWGWDAEGNPIKDCPYGPNGMEEGECGL